MPDIDAFLDNLSEAERSGDIAALEHALTDDFVGIGPSASCLPREAWLGRHRQGEMHYETFALDEMDTREYGPVAVVTARHRATGDYQGNPIPEAVRASLVLVDDGGAWRLGRIHMSFIAGAPGSPPFPGS